MTRLRNVFSKLCCTALLLGCTSLSGCFIHEYSVGTGGTGIANESDRQVYFLFGLFRMNEIDPEGMAQESTSYTVRTEFALSDVMLSVIGFPVGFSTRSITVTR